MYFIQKTKGVNFFKEFDYLLFTAVLFLSAVGLIVLSSATRTMQNGSSIMIKQAISLFIGILISIIISAIDYKDFKILGIFLYIVSVALLVVVLIFGTGKESWGSRSWLGIPLIGSFQPSEIAKITVIIMSSMFFERIKEGQAKKGDIPKLVLYTLIPVGLILLQPDYGTAMVFIFVLAVMIFINGIKYKYIFITLGSFIAAMPLLWLFVLKDYQKWRIRTFLNPGLDPLGKGWQVSRSKLAIGSGQLYGKQLYRGIQTQNGGVPVRESDFIFSVIGEELGFIGSVTIILVILFILLRCLHIARNSRDQYGCFLAVGLTSMLGFHFIENIGMCIGILPVTGIPLPFISAGGSAMITNYFAIGIILSISMRRKRTIFNNPV